MLLLKLAIVPVLIALITLVGRRFGPAVAGRVAGLPVVAGPILLWVAMEQGPVFAARAAGGALAATTGNVVFCLAYAWCATRYGWWVCLLAGYLTFAVTAFGLQWMGLDANGTFVLCLCVIAVTARCFPKSLPPEPVQRALRAELPARMLAGAALVWLVTSFAETWGPSVSGVLSAPPLLASVLAGFSHALVGPGFAVRLLRAMAMGMYALAAFLWALASALSLMGVAAAFGLALVIALLVSTGIAWVVERRARQ
jgi:hypothetical protein